ncbi:hypothetical protein LTR53_002433 [Teratosphaeriaceae sp. CCFEE 6253]|nr:hypothetical protein LTR53_002433 [Teratosphaeriaceae sp. CCFEE 6253]
MGLDAQLAQWLHSYKTTDGAARTALLKMSPNGHVPIEIIFSLPVMPCHMLYDLKRVNLDCGILLCDNNYVVLAMAHLYTAARQYGLITTSWGDMDLLIVQNSKKRAYVAPADKAQDAYSTAKNYQLALGVTRSSSSRAHNGLKDLPPASVVSNKARQIEAASSFLRKMPEQTKRMGALGRSADDIMQFVLQTLADESQAASHASGSDEKPRDDLDQPCSPMHLLQAFKDDFLATEIQLNFDHIAFSQRCSILMTAIARLGCPTLSDTPIRAPQHCYELVDCLLREAAEAVAANKPLTETTFSKAARLLESLYKSRADKQARAAHEQSSGHIPQQLRPSLASPSPYNSDCRETLERHGFLFDGDRRGAAIYAPAEVAGHLKNDMNKTAFILAQAKEVGGPAVWLALNAGLRGDIGPRRYEVAFALVRLSSGSEVPVCGK